MKIKILSLPKHNFADGGDIGNGVTTFSGLKHGQFGLDGIPQGIASDGLPNYVQGGGFDKNGNPLKGEIKYKDYIYGKLKITKELADKYHLPEKWVGLKYQEAADIAQQESEDRPNDPISISTLDDWMLRLQSAQEETKASNAVKRAAKLIDGMSDEEKMGILAMMQGEEQPIMADGGKIRIKKSKKGTFTAAAKKHGKSVQEFALQVLAHPENYSPAMRKKANFARVSKSWNHSNGGHLFPLGGKPQYIFNDADLAMMVGGLGIRPTTTAVETPNGSVMLANPVLPEADLNSAINSAYEREFGSMSEEQVDRALGQNSTTSANSNLRFAPAVGSFLGMLQSALQPRDYTLANQLRDIASQYNPVSAPSIGGYRRYTPYDVNLGDAENLALQASALRSSRGQNRATQAAINAALINKFQETSAKRNLAAQEANEQRRAAIDAYNQGIDKQNAALAQAYDQLNASIKDKRLGLMASAAQAQDASDTAWSNSLSTTAKNFFNQLGRVGEDQWAYEQFMKLFPYLKS